MAPNPPSSFLVALSLVGAGAVLVATSQHGAGLSPDAVGYIGVARQLLAGQGVTGFDGKPFVIQPPLYPALLALAGRMTGQDPLRVAPFVNGLLCGAAVFLTALLCARHRRFYPTLAPFGPAFALLSWPFFAVGAMAWSEPLFIAVELGCLLCLGRYLEEGRIGWVLALAAGVGLACLTRYIGLAFVLGGGAVLAGCSPLPWRRRLLHLLLFAGLAALPLLVWLARNQDLTGTWLGPRHPSSHSLAVNLALTFTGLSGFWVPEVLVDERLVRLGLGGVVAAGAGAALVGLTRLPRPARASLKGLAPVATWGAAYALFLIASSTTTAYDDINLRLLAPLYPPAVVLLLAGAGQLAERRWAPGVRVVLVLLLLLPLAGIGRAGALYARQGAGADGGADRYNTERWRRSETIEYLRRQALPGPVYSNAPDALYILCGRRAFLLPRRDQGQAWPDSGHLVWLAAVRRGYLPGPAELQAHLRLRLVASFADGALYSISPPLEE